MAKGEVRNAMLAPGETAPPFTLKSQTGAAVRLADYRGNKNVVLFFYPKDFSPGCTKEVCHFRDSYEKFTKMGAAVVGISLDDEASHQRFASQYKLPYPLLTDVRGEVRDEYGIKKTLGLFPGRVTFVIDKQGVVQHVYSSQMNAEQHIEEALTALQSLKH